jgi:hypothetical protein
VIAEPWFTLRGHPAQSLLNTARTLGRRDDVVYVISHDPARTDLLPINQELQKYGTVCQFPAAGSAAVSTVRALRLAGRIARGQKRPVSVFFLDAHLLALAIATPLLGLLLRGVGGLCALGLVGPEAIAGSGSWRNAVLRRWLERAQVRLYLRTDELATAWRDAFSGASGHIGTLPSLEIPPGESVPVSMPTGPTKFGVIGQIRVGKGLEWLVPLFSAHPGLGELRISGNFFNATQRESLPMVAQFAGFAERFLRDEELVPTAAAVDYLLVLYDVWDPRLEAATFFLAARAGRPVICYDSGWCGRMIAEYGCGIAVRTGTRPDAAFFSGLPARGSPEYGRWLQGSNRFRLAHAAETQRGEFLRKVTSGTSQSR